MTALQKPARKPGLVCYFARWDRDGRLREALYRRPDRNAQPAPIQTDASPPPTRNHQRKASLTKKPSQGVLDL